MCYNVEEYLYSQLLCRFAVKIHVFFKKVPKGHKMSYNKNNNFKNGEKKDFGKKKNFSPRNRRGDANPGSGKTYNNGESFDEGL